jgi:hypothetical protein
VLDLPHTRALPQSPSIVGLQHGVSPPKEKPRDVFGCPSASVYIFVGLSAVPTRMMVQKGWVLR